MRPGKLCHAYVITNRSRTLYTGVTSDLRHRVWQHKTGKLKGFTSRYKMDRLAYYEPFQYINNAIAREKEIKGWTKVKKVALIVSMNPTWKDLSEGWYSEVELKS
jgi:putative endonuclease